MRLPGARGGQATIGILSLTFSKVIPHNGMSRCFQTGKEDRLSGFSFDITLKSLGRIIERLHLLEQVSGYDPG